MVVLDDDDEGVIDDICKGISEVLPTADFVHYRSVAKFLSLEEHQINADVVLLDVRDMDLTPLEAIPRIKECWPRLPIIILSKVDLLESALLYFRAGARGYILKSDFRFNKRRTSSESLVVARAAYQNAANLIRDVAREYRPIKRLLYDDRIIGRLVKESKGSESDLPKQIAFLERIKEMTDWSLKRRFPIEILLRPTDNSYETPFYKAKSLRETLFQLEDQDEIAETGEAVLGTLLIDLKKKLFDRNHKAATQDKSSWFQNSYSNKLEVRLEETRQEAEKCSVADKCAILSLLAAKRLIIDGKEMVSPVEILDQLKSDAASMERVIPEKKGYIHGDLHFSNILIDTTILERPFIKVIDPKGFLEADFAYDVGKLLFSCDGFDMIDGGYLGSEKLVRSVEEIDTETVKVDQPERVYTKKKLITSGLSVDTVYSYEQEIRDLHFEGYKRIASWLFQFLPTLLNDDPNWQVRARLNEALHFCTVGKFHLKRNRTDEGPIKVIAFYVAGVQVMNEVARELGLSLQH